MVTERIAQRYAKAIFEMAEKNNQLDVVLADFANFNNLLATTRDFKLLLESPIVKSGTKLEIFRKIFLGKVSKDVMGLMEMLCERNRESLIPFIGTEYIKLVNKARNITPVTAISSVALTADQQKMISDKVAAILKSNIQLTNTIHPEILGGVILNIEGKQYDASVTGSLARLKKQLLAS